MKQEDKDLLLKDLCARLPYNPMVEYKGEMYNVLGISHGRLVLCKPFMSYTLDEHPLIEEAKPYLFPLSSMTEEQKKEFISVAGYETNEETNTKKITKTDFYSDGLCGADNSTEKREELKKMLRLLKHLSANMLLDVLNRLYTYDEYKGFIKEIEDK